MCSVKRSSVKPEQVSGGGTASRCRWARRFSFVTPRTPRAARSLSLAPIMRFKLSNILYAFAIGIASPYIILRTNEIAKDYFAIVIGLSMLASAMGAYLAGFYLKPRKITLSLNRIIEMIVLLLFGYAGTLMQILTLNCIIVCRCWRVYDQCSRSRAKLSLHKKLRYVFYYNYSRGWHLYDFK